MWEIFVAIFSGAYWIGRLGRERAEARKTDTEIAESAARQRKWRELVVDDELSRQLISVANTDDGFNKLCSRGIHVIRNLPGMQYADFNCRLNKSTQAMVRLIEAVSLGKLPCGYEHDISPFIWQSTDLKFSKEAMVAFAKWVEETLQEFGHKSAALYCCQNTNSEYDFATKTYYPCFYWECCLPPGRDAIRITDPNIEQLICGETNEQTYAVNLPQIMKKKRDYKFSTWSKEIFSSNTQEDLENKFNEDGWESITGSTLAFIRTLPGLESANYQLSNKKFGENCKNLVMLIEMSKLGKLPRNCLWGLSCNQLQGVIDKPLSIDAKIVFALYIENALKSNGVVDAELYYRIPGAVSDTAEALRHINYGGPEFLWAASMYTDNGFVRITADDLPAIMRL